MGIVLVVTSRIRRAVAILSDCWVCGEVWVFMVKVTVRREGEVEES